MAAICGNTTAAAAALSNVNYCALLCINNSLWWFWSFCVWINKNHMDYYIFSVCVPRTMRQNVNATHTNHNREGCAYSLHDERIEICAAPTNCNEKWQQFTLPFNATYATDNASVLTTSIVIDSQTVELIRRSLRSRSSFSKFHFPILFRCNEASNLSTEYTQTQSCWPCGASTLQINHISSYIQSFT